VQLNKLAVVPASGLFHVSLSRPKQREHRRALQYAFRNSARYSGKQYSTLDNTDIVSHVFGAFDDFLVVDMKIHYNAIQNFSFDFGIDNIFNEQYFLFHPFPGRTFVLAAKYTL
jgi:iron complex outermembrane receptor protein